MPVGGLTQRCATWTEPTYGRISTRLGQKGEGDQALGRSRGGLGTEICVRIEGRDKPGHSCCPGSTARGQPVRGVEEPRKVRRSGRGCPRIKPKQICGDKRYSSRRIRAYIRHQGTRYTIPQKTNKRRTGPLDRALHRRRNLVECTTNRLKQFRRIATR